MQQSAKLFSVLLFCTVSNLCLADTAPPLKSHEGYLVLDLQLGRKVTAIQFIQQSRKSKLRTVTITLGPYEAGRYLELLPLKKGKYLIDEVLVPHYDLPFRANFENEVHTEITIEQDRINYAAQIWVGEERGSNSVSVRVVNRLAYSLPELKKRYAELLAQFPLSNGGPLPDHFFSEFLQTEGIEP